MRRFKILIIFLICQSIWLTAQTLPDANFSAGNADLDAVGRNPNLDFVFRQYRSQKDIVSLSNIEGSPFLDENFIKTAIHSPDGLEGYVYSRYDAYNEEVQLKKYLGQKKIETLLKREDIYCVRATETIVYSAYFDKKQNQIKGHLFKRMEAGELVVFQRVQKRYKEGKEAKTSLEIAVPNKFIDASEFYFKKGKEGKVQFLKRSKKVVLDLFKEDREKQEAMKIYMSKNKINLKKEAGMSKILAYYQQL